MPSEARQRRRLFACTETVSGTQGRLAPIRASNGAQGHCNIQIGGRAASPADTSGDSAYRIGGLSFLYSIERLQRADLVVLQFPPWWHAVPALLEGRFDRVFVYAGIHTGSMRHDRGIFACTHPRKIMHPRMLESPAFDRVFVYAGIHTGSMRHDRGIFACTHPRKGEFQPCAVTS